MTWLAAEQPVKNRGRAPLSFLRALVAFARTAPAEIFAPNDVPVDIFTVIKSSLATPAGTDPSGTDLYAWQNLEHRRAALMEAMRVHAGFESSWQWNEGVDRTNRTSLSNPEHAEAGIFQVSFDSELLGSGALKPFAHVHDIATPAKFIAKMKSNRGLALEYYARLVRVSIAWAGPLLRHGPDSIYPYLSRAAVAEFQSALLE